MIDSLALLMSIVCTSIECLILWRGWRARILVKYPLFFVYIASVLAFDPVLFMTYYLRPHAYAWWYWRAGMFQFVAVLGLLIEINKYCLKALPVANAFGRRLEWFLLFITGVTASRS